MRIRSPLNSRTQSRLEQQARQHRSCLTESEARLWSALKARQLGVQFRPEVLLGGRFIVDFFASSVGLVVEVDGGYHARCKAATKAAILSCAGSAIASSAWMRSSCFAISAQPWRSSARRSSAVHARRRAWRRP